MRQLIPWARRPDPDQALDEARRREAAEHEQALRRIFDQAHADDQPVEQAS